MKSLNVFMAIWSVDGATQRAESPLSSQENNMNYFFCAEVCNGFLILGRNARPKRGTVFEDISVLENPEFGVRYLAEICMYWLLLISHSFMWLVQGMFNMFFF